MKGTDEKVIEEFQQKMTLTLWSRANEAKRCDLSSATRGGGAEPRKLLSVKFRDEQRTTYFSLPLLTTCA